MAVSYIQRKSPASGKRKEKKKGLVESDSKNKKKTKFATSNQNILKPL
jgi:hypothetical protein